MTIAQLAHPEWFGVVVTGWVVCALALAGARWLARRRLVALLGPRRPSAPSTQKWVSDTALLVALALIGVALLGPRIGERTVEASASGVDLVVLVDVSRSMDAADTPPSRLDRAQRAVEEVLARLEPTDRVALAAFASRGVVLTPLTPDHGALQELLGALDTQLIHPAGSDLGEGVRAAVEAFEPGSDRPRLLFVVSDGEDPRRRPAVGVPAALGASVRVVAAALGTELGSGVADRGAPLRDAGGQLVVSRRHTERLARLVDATGGVLFEADAWGAIDFDATAEAIRRDVGQTPGGKVERRVPAIAVAPFALAAFLLLLLEGLPRWGFGPGVRGASVAAIVLLSLGATPASNESDEVEIPSGALEAWARNHPANDRLLLALGRARLFEGEAAGAARAFAAAAVYARSPEVAARAYYARGVAELERGDHARARDAFFDALALDPDDERARFNLEWTLLALNSEPPPAPDPPPILDPTETGEPDERVDKRDADEPEPGAPEPDASDSPQPVQPLDSAQRLRALQRVRDDLARAIGTTARVHPRERSSEPAW